MQIEDIPARPHALRRGRQTFVAAAFGRGRQDIGVLIVIPPLDPSADDEMHIIQLQIVLEMLGHLPHQVGSQRFNGSDFHDPLGRVEQLAQHLQG